MNNIDFVLVFAAIVCFVLDAFDVKAAVKFTPLGFALLAATLIV